MELAASAQHTECLNGANSACRQNIIKHVNQRSDRTLLGDGQADVSGASKACKSQSRVHPRFASPWLF